MKLTAITTLVAMALAGATFAAPPEGAPRHQRGPMGMRGGMEMGNDPVVRIVNNPRAAKKVGLSEEQIKKIAEIKKSTGDANQAMSKQLREEMDRQIELLKAEKVDEAAVMATIDKIFDIRKEMAKNQTRRVIAIKALMTPEQIAKALEIAKEPPRKRGDGPKRHQGGKGNGDAPPAPDAQPDSPAPEAPAEG